MLSSLLHNRHTTLLLLFLLITPTSAHSQTLITPATYNNPFITPLSAFLTGLTVLALFTVLPQAPFSFSRAPSRTAMPSDPRAQASSSSSSREKSSSSSSSRPSSSSSSSSSAPPSGGGGGGAGPPQGPYISANAWMSFFLFCCLVLIILQGPLGLSNIGNPAFGFGLGAGGMMPALGGLTSGIGCQGMAAAYVPWCSPHGLGLGVGVQPVQAMAVAAAPAPAPAVVHHHHAAPAPAPVVQHRYTTQPRYGAQGSIMMPGGGGGQWSSWYQPRSGYTYARPPASRQFQYQRPGLNVQVNQGAQPGGYTTTYEYEQWTYDYLCFHLPYLCQPIIPYAYAYTQPAPDPVIAPAPPAAVVVPPAAPIPPTPVLSANTLMGITNLESAFFPLLVGAIALLVIFDYSS